MVKYLTKEPNPSSPIFATNARILEFSNYAQQEVASRTQCFISSNVPNSTGNPTLSTVAGTRLYDFPSDCLELLTVKVSVWTCKRMTLDQLNMLTGYQWWQYSGPPLYYWIEKKNTNFLSEMLLISENFIYRTCEGFDKIRKPLKRGLLKK